MNELIVGIDLGTTNSALAVVIDGRVKVIDIHGQPTMPSSVGLDPAGNLLVGQAARNQIIAAPDRTILSVKRRMGEDVKLPLGDKSFSPEEISALILSELKREGEKALGQPIRKAVITVPAFFNEVQRRATQAAGELAGLEVVRIIHEPTAAALAYGGEQRQTEKMLVYDLGGGTFDVSVVVVEDGVVEVKASHGDTQLGGDDFDDLLVNHALQVFTGQHGKNLSEDPATRRRLKIIMERAKIELSDQPFVQVREEYLDGEHHLDFELSREDYEEMIERLLEKTLNCMHASLADAKLLTRDLDKVMLVGGATRTPLVHRILADRTGLDPKWEINPDLIVAMGAAVQGAIIGGDTSHAILVDITTHTFAVNSFDPTTGINYCVPIIRRGTPLPATKTEPFQTLADRQREVQVEVFQGEGSLPNENLLIGEYMVSGLAPVPAGNVVLFRLDLDLNGMLKATSIEKATGFAKSITIDTRGGHVLDLEAARRNIAHLVNGADDDETDDDDEDGEGFEDVIARPTEALTTAKDLRKRAEALLAKGISEDDAAEIKALIHGSTVAVESGDWPALKKSNDTLGDLLFYLED